MDPTAGLLSPDFIKLILQAGAFGVLVLFQIMNFFHQRDLKNSADRMRGEMFDLINRTATESRADHARVLKIAQTIGREYRSDNRNLINEFFRRLDRAEDTNKTGETNP